MNSQVYVQRRAGHSNGSITERYVHAAQVALTGAAGACRGPDILRRPRFGTKFRHRVDAQCLHRACTRRQFEGGRKWKRQSLTN